MKIYPYILCKLVAALIVMHATSIAMFEPTEEFIAPIHPKLDLIIRAVLTNGGNDALNVPSFWNYTPPMMVHLTYLVMHPHYALPYLQQQTQYFYNIRFDNLENRVVIPPYVFQYLAQASIELKNNFIDTNLPDPLKEIVSNTVQFNRYIHSENILYIITTSRNNARLDCVSAAPYVKMIIQAIYAAHNISLMQHISIITANTSSFSTLEYQDTVPTLILSHSLHTLLNQGNYRQSSNHSTNPPICSLDVNPLGILEILAVRDCLFYGLQKCGESNYRAALKTMLSQGLDQLERDPSLVQYIHQPKIISWIQEEKLRRQNPYFLPDADF